MLALVCSAALASADGTAPNLFRVHSMTDSKGALHRIPERRNAKAVVLVFLGTECPISQRYIPELNRIAGAHETNAVEFYGVVAGRTMTPPRADAFATEYGLKFPLLCDSDLRLARWLRPTHVPQAYVLKSDGDIVYRGRIDDGYEGIGKPRTVVQHHELRDAITAVLAGRTPDRFFAPPVGCYFEELSRP